MWKLLHPDLLQTKSKLSTERLKMWEKGPEAFLPRIATRDRTSCDCGGYASSRKWPSRGRQAQSQQIQYKQKARSDSGGMFKGFSNFLVSQKTLGSYNSCFKYIYLYIQPPKIPRENLTRESFHMMTVSLLIAQIKQGQFSRSFEGALLAIFRIVQI